MTCSGWRAAVVELEAMWRFLLEEHHPAAPRDEWFIGGDCSRPRVHAKKVRYVVEVFGVTESAAALKYMLTEWDEIRARFSRAPPSPTVGYFRAIAPFLVRHEYTSADIDRLLVALREFGETNPFDLPPDRLTEHCALITAAVAHNLPSRGGRGMPKRRRRFRRRRHSAGW